MKIFIRLISLLIFQIMMGSISIAAVAPPKNPNSAKGCAICHYRWIDTFFVDGKGSDLVEYQSEKVAAKPEMCFSCHDGSVMDSRARVYHGKEHKTNMPPPSNMKIPKIFPLDEKGNVQCSTCHTAHGVASGTGIHETIFLRTSNKDSTMCRMCHPDKEGGTDAGNHPLGTSKQMIPRNLKIRGAIEGRKKGQVICETCHTAHGSLHESFLIQGAGDCGLCLECHRDKEVFTREGKRKPFHIINIRPKKVKMSEELIRRGAKLGYNGVITCQTCHKVHNNQIEQQLLLIKKDQKSGLCLTCHSDKKSLVDTKHNLNRSAPTEKNLQGQTVLEAGICSACHLPHKAARKFYIKVKDADTTAQLCLDCHNEKSMGNRKVIKDYSHPVNISPFKKGFTTTLPLFDENGRISKDGVMACPTCHDPHRLEPLRISPDNCSDNEKKSQNSFLRIDNFPSPKLCENCHGDKGDLERTDHDLKITAPFSKNNVCKTPVESGTCGVCHLVHNSTNRILLWAQDLDAGDNVMEKMCNSCHSEKGSAKNKIPQISSHPKVQIIATERNIKNKLNYFPLFNETSGEPVQVGNISCPSCHNVHQWTENPFTKREGINAEGNASNSFIRAQVHNLVCKECHGLDALFRFKFFHKASARLKKGTDAQQK